MPLILQVQDMIKMLATEKYGDADSLTDSGKGPSEPGEGDKNADPHKRKWIIHLQHVQ